MRKYLNQHTIALILEFVSVFCPYWICHGKFEASMCLFKAEHSTIAV